MHAFSICGLVFLGVGDTVACWYGREFGTVLWRVGGKKTTEGSFAALFFMCIGYCFLISIVHPNMMHAFVSIVFSTFIVTAIEGLTN